MRTDRSKCLNEIEHTRPESLAFDSYLTSTCHRLRDKPLSAYSTEDLRIMTGQGISPTHLIPLAIERLEGDPIAQGDFYAGDLLKAVISGTPIAFWLMEPSLALRLTAVLSRAQARIPQLSTNEAKTLADSLAECSEKIQEINGAANHRLQPTRLPGRQPRG